MSNDSEIEEWHSQNDLNWPDWQNAESLSDIGNLTIEWLEGDRLVLVNHVGAPADETKVIKSKLIEINKLGLVTNNSQSRLFGQKAWVTGVIRKSLAVELACSIYEAGLHIEIARLDTPWPEDDLLRPPWDFRIPPTNIIHFFPETISMSEKLAEDLEDCVGVVIWDTKTRKEHLWDTVITALSNSG